MFEDKDGSGKPSAGNPGLANVMVSNGRDVALTDADGRYKLSLEGPAIVHVIKPAGFMPPVDPETGSPRFYCIHQPNGSPPDLNSTFDGVAPTGPLPATVDFALRRQDEPKAFDVVMVTDPQPETEAEVDFIREDVFDALAGVDAHFGLTAGDITFDDLSLYPRSNAIIGTIGLPWWSIGGNHDLNFEAPDRRISRETFKRVFGPQLLRVRLREDLVPDARRRRLSWKRRDEAPRRGQISGQARRRSTRLHQERPRSHP